MKPIGYFVICYRAKKLGNKAPVTYSVPMNYWWAKENVAENNYRYPSIEFWIEPYKPESHDKPIREATQ